jgi:hypothetical protein
MLNKTPTPGKVQLDGGNIECSDRAVACTTM